MGARGPAPTPTAILNMRGSWRGKLNPGEPQPERGRPRRPKHLTATQKRVWSLLTRQLDAMGVLSRADGRQLERYCVYFLRWRQCEAWIAEHGLTSETERGPVEYAEVRESHRLDKALKQIEANFGLTPSARSRITVGGGGEGEDDGKARFFKGA